MVTAVDPLATVLASRSSLPREEEAMQARRAISGCTGGEEETPLTKRTVSGYGCIGGEEEVSWVKKISRSYDG